MNTTTNPQTPAQFAAALTAVHALAEAIRTVGPIPSGHLYAMVCGAMTLETYNGALGLLKRTGLVEEKGHMLSWSGPALEK